jgi:hypothetical protein
MDIVRSLAEAMTDGNCELRAFLALFREAQRATDRFTREFALDVLLHKCANLDSDQWLQFYEYLQDDSADVEYLQRISCLGRLFLDRSSPQRDEKRVEAIIWLIRSRPTDYCLGLPQSRHVEDAWYDSVESEWLAAIRRNPDDVRVLSNAARFFCIPDREKCESLYTKCADLEPDESEWQRRIQRLRELHSD